MTTAGSATTFGGWLALVVAVVASLAVGVGVGTPLAVAGGVLGGAGLAWTARRAGGDRPADHVAAGVGFVLAFGILGVAGYVAIRSQRTGIVALVTAAVFLVGANGLTRFFDGAGDDCRRVALVSALVPVGVLAVALGVAVLVRLGEVFLPVRRVTTFALLVSLQVEVLVVAGLLNLATGVVDRWQGRTDREDASGGSLMAAVGASVAKLEALHPSMRDPWTVTVYAGLFLQLLLALTLPGLLEDVLATIPVLGPAVVTVLERQWLHLPFDVLLVLSAAILGIEAVRLLVVRWAEPDPPRTLGYATGSASAVVLLGLASVLPWTRGAFADAVPSAGPVPAVAVALVALALVFVAAFALLFVAKVLPVLSPVPDRSPGFAVGAALLFLAALGVGLAGAFPPLVFAVAAAAFLVWDVGATGTDLGASLGPGADTDRGEFVLAATTTLVGVGAVVLATVSLYAFGPLSGSVPAWRGYLAMLFALVALSSLAVYLVRSAPE